MWSWAKRREAPPHLTVVIARESGRSSIPEAPAIEPEGRGVLDHPLSRMMTTGLRVGFVHPTSGAASLLRHLCDRVHRRDVAVRPQPADHAGRGMRQPGMAVVFVAGMDVGNVHLQDRPLERLQRVEDRDRGKGIAGRIDDDGVRGFPRRLDQVDQRALMVRLVKRDCEPQLRGVLLAIRLDLCQRRGPVNVRLPYAQQIEVRPVQDHQSFHGVPLPGDVLLVFYARYQQRNPDRAPRNPCPKGT